MRRRLMMLPFGYDLEFVPYKRRNPETRLVKGYLPAQVRELSGDEAPVALTIVHHEAYLEATPEARARHYPDGPNKSVYRQVDGRLLSPLRTNDGEALPVAMFEEGIARDSDHWVSYGFVGRSYKPDAGWSVSGYPSMPWYKKPSSFNEVRSPMELMTAEEFAACSREAGEPVRIRGGDRDARQAAATEVMARDIVVVDGTVWTAKVGFEPRWAVVESSNGKVDVDLNLGTSTLHYRHLFRLDRLDAALAFAKARGEALGRELDVTPSKVEITDPSFIHMDEAVEVARQFISHVDWVRDRDVSGMARGLGGLVRMDESMTPGLAGEAYAFVRAGLDAGAIAPTPQMIAALERFGEMVAARPELAHDASADEQILAGLGR